MQTCCTTSVFDLHSLPCVDRCGHMESRKETEGKKWLLPAFSSLSEMSARALILQQALGYVFTSLLAKSWGWISPMGIWKMSSHQSCPSCTPQAFYPSEVHVQALALRKHNRNTDMPKKGYLSMELEYCKYSLQSSFLLDIFVRD